MAEYRVGRPSDLGRLMALHAGERMRRMEEAQFEAAQAGVEIVRPLLPRDLGTLQDSVHARRIPGGAELTIDAPHAPMIEAGARPHTPPLGPLIEWVTRHAAFFVLLDQGDVEGRPMRSVRARAKQTIGQAGIVRIARAIQQKIAREGSPPRWIMKGSRPRLREILGEKIAAKLALPPTSSSF